MNEEKEVPTKLWAFWQYDRFPSFLSAPVNSFTEDGRAVTVNGQEGYSYRYFLLLPDDFGEALSRAGRALRDVHDEEMQKVQHSLYAAALHFFKVNNLPSPPQAQGWPTRGATPQLIETYYRAFEREYGRTR